ncbi:hypothetical protein FOCC_FOCC010925 [Frankliniella occidentalis]|nr:hypothetical protein FOCC_FOCC010925 [Frankliniella occidentalis]
MNSLMKASKTEIQQKFRDTLGLSVDEVRQGGGNSNDGNTARRFFKEYDTTAAILGLDADIIKRCCTILQVLASGRKINVEEFEKYALSCARDLVRLYDWYHLPPSVHKVLIHGGAIIRAAELPIGLYGEEAQECRNKHLRGNRDVLNMMLCTSDPYLYTKRSITPKVKKKPTPEMLALFLD